MGQDRGEVGFPAYLQEAINDAGFTTPTQFARKAGIEPSVILRWLSGESQPTLKLLERASPVLGKEINDMVAAAYPAATRGARKLATPSQRKLHPLADELDRMLSDDSPLDDDMRQRVVVVVDAGMAPARKLMRRRRPAS